MHLNQQKLHPNTPFYETTQEESDVVRPTPNRNGQSMGVRHEQLHASPATTPVAQSSSSETAGSIGNNSTPATATAMVPEASGLGTSAIAS